MITHFIRPPFLKKGDKIGIAAPARKISASELKPAIELFNNWGLEVVLASNIYNSFHQFAGTDNERIAGYQEMLDDTSIKAIISARGGYGCLRIVDNLDFSTFLSSPKWITGYSDLTVFHSHIHNNYSIETLHSTMAINIPNNTQSSLESLRKALFGESIEYKQEPHHLNRLGSAHGILTGGNISILYALSSSVSDIEFAGKILFIEDLEEYLYHIDRMLMQLKRSGKLAQLAGLIVGGMNNMNDNTIPYGKNAYEIISEAISEYDYPVCFNFPAGHLDDNKTLILGRQVELVVDKGLTTLCYK